VWVWSGMSLRSLGLMNKGVQGEQALFVNPCLPFLMKLDELLGRSPPARHYTLHMIRSEIHRVSMLQELQVQTSLHGPLRRVRPRPSPPLHEANRMGSLLAAERSSIRGAPLP
jgi:hypothetical protein